MNKKGIVGDMFDIMFTIVATVFILLFIGVTINHATTEKIDVSLDHLDKTGDVDTYLTQQRENLILDRGVDAEEMKSQIKEIIS